MTLKIDGSEILCDPTWVKFPSVLGFFGFGDKYRNMPVCNKKATDTWVITCSSCSYNRHEALCKKCKWVINGRLKSLDFGKCEGCNSSLIASPV